MSHQMALLQEAITVANQLGFSVCQEFLDGVGGVQPAIVQQHPWIVLDREQPPASNLARLVEFLADEATALPPMSAELRRLFPHQQRQAA